MISVILLICILFGLCIIKRIIFPPTYITKFNVNITPFNQTLISPVDHQLLLSIVRRVDHIASNNVEYFLMAGGLLGAARYQNRMPWDDDIDIGITAANVKKFESLPFSKVGLSIKKVYFGYKIYDTSFHRRNKLEETFPFVDVFIFEEKGNKIQLIPEVLKKWPREIYNYTDIFPLSKCKFANMNLPCPNDTHTVLSTAYPGWDKFAYIDGSHTGQLLIRQYILSITPENTAEIREYLQGLPN